MTELAPDHAGTADDPVTDAVESALRDVISGAEVSVTHGPVDGPVHASPSEFGEGSAVGEGPPGWWTTVRVTVDDRIRPLLGVGSGTALDELLRALPGAGVRAAQQLRPRFAPVGGRLDAALARAVRDVVATELLGGYAAARVGAPIRPGLVSDAVDYLIELSGTRVEARAVTHGLVVTDLLTDEPRLEFSYPGDLRIAKRAPLLFDGQRSLLVVDPDGRARTEVQWHRLDRLSADAEPIVRRADRSVEGGLLVAEATGLLGGIGFYLRADRSIWTFADGRPLLVRQGEHWTAFPLQLSASIAAMIGDLEVAALVARTALIISAQPSGAILAIADDPGRLEGVVPVKDRYDLRDAQPLADMRPETRLHHLIDADDLDEHTLARLAALDGATVVDHDGRLLAYGAVVTSTDSQHEGARTAAARSLSEVTDVVLKVSVDGDITIFRDGAVITQLLGGPSPA